MSMFSTIFGNSEEQDKLNSKINWIPLQHLGQLDEIVAFSNAKPAVIFKHSTRCSVSRFALKQFENGGASVLASRELRDGSPVVSPHRTE